MGPLLRKLFLELGYTLPPIPGGSPVRTANNSVIEAKKVASNGATKAMGPTQLLVETIAKQSLNDSASSSISSTSGGGLPSLQTIPPTSTSKDEVKEDILSDPPFAAVVSPEEESQLSQKREEWAAMYRLSMGCSCFLATEDSILCGTHRGVIRRLPLPVPIFLGLGEAPSSIVQSVMMAPPSDVQLESDVSADDSFRSLTTSSASEFIGHSGAIRAMTYLNPSEFSENVLVSAGADHTVRLWDATEARELVRPVRIANVSSLVGSTNGLQVYCGTFEGLVVTVDAQTGHVLGSRTVHIGPIKGLLPSISDPAHLYSVGLDGLMKCTHVEDGSLISIFEGMSPLRSLFATTTPAPPPAPSSPLLQSKKSETPLPGGWYLLAGTSDGPIRGYDPRTARSVFELRGHADAVVCMDGREALLVSGSDDRTVRQWDVRMQKSVRVFEGHANGVSCVKMLGPETEQFVTGSLDKTIRMWNLATMNQKDGRSVSVSLRDTMVLSDLKNHFFKHAKSTDADSGAPAMLYKHFKKSCNQLGLQNETTVKAMFRHFDFSGDGLIDLTEMLTALEGFMFDNFEQVIKDCFKLFDDDGSGVVSLVELNLTLARGAKTIARLGLTPMMIEEMGNLLKFEAGGDIDYEEFKGFMSTRASLLKSMFPVVAVGYCQRKGICDLHSASEIIAPEEDAKGTKNRRGTTPKPGAKASKTPTSGMKKSTKTPTKTKQSEK